MSLCCPVVQTGLADSEHNFTPIKCPLRPASYRPQLSSISFTRLLRLRSLPTATECQPGKEERVLHIWCVSSADRFIKDNQRPVRLILPFELHTRRVWYLRSSQAQLSLESSRGSSSSGEMEQQGEVRKWSIWQIMTCCVLIVIIKWN